MPKVFHCTICLNTACPTSGKKCQLEAGESFSTDSEVIAPSSHNEITGTDEILRQLHQLGEKMDYMDKRVQWMEAALEKGHSQATDIPSTSQGAAGQVMGYDSDAITVQSVVTRIFEE